MYSTLKTIRFARGILWIAAVGLVAYFALRASPHLSEIGWLPEVVANWADRHGVLRNLPAFGLLYLVGLVAFGSGYAWRVCGLVCLIAVVLEAGQLMLPARTFDRDDILFSWAGVLVVHLPLCLIRHLRSSSADKTVA